MKYTLILLMIVVIAIFYLVFGYNGLLKYSQMREIHRNYQDRLVEIDRKIKDMKDELDVAKKDRLYLENIIRRELGMQKQGEDLYLILDNNSKK